jgi:hypothetical protein
MVHVPLSSNVRSLSLHIKLAHSCPPRVHALEIIEPGRRVVDVASKPTVPDELW